MPKKPDPCQFCYGYGIEDGKGVTWRRPVPSGPKGQIHPAWKNCKRRPCDRCGVMKP